MKAMILAAGLGSRMRPITDHIPKPLLKVGKGRLIEWHLWRLKECGFSEIVINIAHLGSMIPAIIGNGSRYGLDIIYSDEQQSGGLESAGGIIKALKYLDSEPFLVVNGDVLCNYPFDSSFRLPKEKLAHLVLVDNPPHNPQGDFGLSCGNATLKKELTFSGIGYYCAEFFGQLEVQKLPLAPLLKEAISNEAVSAEHYGGIWCDVGTPQRLEMAQQIAKDW